MQFMQKTIYGCRLSVTGIQQQKTGRAAYDLLTKSLLVMKLTVFFLLLGLFTVQAEGLSQQITFSGKDVKLQEVFQAIRKQTGYFVAYERGALDKTKPVSVKAVNQPLTEFLRKVLEGQGLSFTIESTTIIIAQETANKISILPDIEAPFPITGTVRGADGRLLSGATIRVKGRQLYTTTNEEGVFNLSADKGDVLVVSYVGYENQEVAIRSEGNMVITLQQKNASIDSVTVSVVVNTGYQRILPQQVTGAVSQIRTKAYESRISTDFLSGLQNRLPGLLINNDVQFQGNNLFQIRGISTMTGNPKPLIVVDGFPTDLALTDINPNEIETVTILKDAAAAAIYGVRASNGVIIIDRKKGVAGKPQFAFRSTVSVKPHENYSRYRYEKDGSVAMKYFRDYWQDGNDPGLDFYVNSEVTGELPYLSGNSSDAALSLLVDKFLGKITQQQMEQGLKDLTTYNNAKDYEKYFLRTGVTQQYNLNISGGNSNAIYYLTGNYLGNRLNQQNNQNHKVQLSGRLNLALHPKLSFELLTDYNETSGNTAPIPDINDLYADERFVDKDGNPLPVVAGSSKVGSLFTNATLPMGFLDQRLRPVTEMNEVNTRLRVSDYRITANLKYKIGAGFDFTVGGIYESSITQQRRIASEHSSLTQTLINSYVQPAAGATPAVYHLPKGGYLQEQYGRLRSYTTRAQLNYNKMIASDHSVNAIIGAEIRKAVTEGSKSASFGYNDQTLQQLPVDYNRLLNAGNRYNFSFLFNPALKYADLFGQSYNDDRFVSGYMNAVYAYKGRYSLTGSIRIDQSNLFGTDPKYRYKPLWSLGAAWNIDRENFMQADWVNMLKLRVARGFNGNISKASLPQVISQYGLNDVPLTPLPSLSLLSPANSGLRWEQTDNFNVGVDFTIFRNISGNIDYYSKRSTDVLGNIDTDPFKGVTSALVNQASISNKGLEFTLNADWIRRKKFNWNTGLVVSYNTSKVLETYVPQLKDGSVWDGFSQTIIASAAKGYMKGQPVGNIYTYRYAGISDNGNALYYDSKGDKVQLNSTNDEGFASLTSRGTSIPTTNLGLSNRIDIGNFYVFAMINYYGGFVVRVPVPSAADPRPIQGAGDYWKQPGDETKVSLPSVFYMSVYGSSHLANSDRYVLNGAYLSISDITVSYNLNKVAALQKAGFSNFEVKLQASNIYTVGFNRDNYSMATGSYLKRYMTPTYTIGLFTNF